MKRFTYEESCRELQKQHWLAAGTLPALLQRPPRCGDESTGVRFVQTMLADAKLERLTLPWTFFGRSEIRSASFADSDLSGSVANWNDFIKVDFSRADLSGADLRANLFEQVRFVGASLAGADLRYGGFKRCDFAGADLTDAKLTRKAGTALGLSPDQQRMIDWQDEEGEEPAGG